MSPSTLETVKRAAGAAEAHGTSLGKPFAVSVVDPGGHVLLVRRQDGVHAAAGDISAARPAPRRSSTARRPPSGS